MCSTFIHPIFFLAFEEWLVWNVCDQFILFWLHAGMQLFMLSLCIFILFLTPSLIIYNFIYILSNCFSQSNSSPLAWHLLFSVIPCVLSHSPGSFFKQPVVICSHFCKDNFKFHFTYLFLKPWYVTIEHVILISISSPDAVYSLSKYLFLW